MFNVNSYQVDTNNYHSARNVYLQESTKVISEEIGNDILSCALHENIYSSMTIEADNSKIGSQMVKEECQEDSSYLSMSSLNSSPSLAQVTSSSSSSFSSFNHHQASPTAYLSIPSNIDSSNYFSNQSSPISNAQQQLACQTYPSNDHKYLFLNNKKDEKHIISAMSSNNSLVAPPPPYNFNQFAHQQNFFNFLTNQYANTGYGNPFYINPQGYPMNKTSNNSHCSANVHSKTAPSYGFLNELNKNDTSFAMNNSNFANESLNLAEFLDNSSSISNNSSSNDSNLSLKSSTKNKNQQNVLLNSSCDQISSKSKNENASTKYKFNCKHLDNIYLNSNINQKACTVINDQTSITTSRLSIEANQRRKRRQRTQFSKYQLNELEKQFMLTSYPDIYHREELSARIGIPEARIQVWFKNRRSKIRKDDKLGGVLTDVSNLTAKTNHQNFTKLTPKSLNDERSFSESYDDDGLEEEER